MGCSSCSSAYGRHRFGYSHPSYAAAALSTSAQQQPATPATSAPNGASSPPSTSPSTHASSTNLNNGGGNGRVAQSNYVHGPGSSPYRFRLAHRPNITRNMLRHGTWSRRVHDTLQYSPHKGGYHAHGVVTSAPNRVYARTHLYAHEMDGGH